MSPRIPKPSCLKRCAVLPCFVSPPKYPVLQSRSLKNEWCTPSLLHLVLFLLVSLSRAVHIVSLLFILKKRYHNLIIFFRYCSDSVSGWRHISRFCSVSFPSVPLRSVLFQQEMAVLWRLKLGRDSDSTPWLQGRLPELRELHGG